LDASQSDALGADSRRSGGRQAPSGKQGGAATTPITAPTEIRHRREFCHLLQSLARNPPFVGWSNPDRVM
jgi:hypothetical protein